MKGFGLRILLPLLISVAFLLMTLLAFLSSRQVVLQEVELKTLSQVRNKVNSLQATVERFLTSNDLNGVRLVLSTVGSELDLIDIFAANEKGQIIASSSYKNENLNWTELDLKLESGIIDRVVSTHVSSVNINANKKWVDAYINICNPVATKSLRPGRCGFIFYRTDLNYHRDKATQSLLTIVGYNIVGTAVIAALLILLLYNLLTKRMVLISGTLQRYLNGKRDARINLVGGSELCQIGRNIDGLLDHLEHEEVALRESEQLKNFIINSADFTIISTYPNGVIRSFSLVAQKKLGYSAEEMINLQTPAIIHDGEEVRARAIALSEELGEPIEPGFEVFVAKARRGGVDRNEWTYISKNGERFPVDLSVTALLDEKGEILGFLGVGDDISIRKRTEERMRLYDKMFATTAEPMLITDKDCNIIDINPAYLEVTGFSREEVIGNKPVIAQSGNHNKEYYKLMWDTIEQQGRWSGEIWDRRKSGELFPMWLTIDAIKDDFNRVINYIGVMKDVTLHKENEEKLERLAYFDPLTRLPNRQLYQDRLEHELAVAQRDKSRFAVFYIDLDYFKLVNDSLGHDAGDDLLVQVSERIKGCLRASDTVARMGGDEFNIIISITDGIKDIRIVAQKIIDELHRSFILRGKEVKIGCSIGISIYPDDSIELDELGKKADMAMYQAKGSGRGCYLFFSEGEKAAKDNHQ